MLKLLLSLALLCSSPVAAAPFSAADDATLRKMTQHYVDGWLQNDRSKVMSVLSQDAVFIPHDGVKPRIGYGEIDEFWFPGGKAVGTVPAFTLAVTNVSGRDDHATLFGRSDLTWQNDEQRYHWIGSFMFVARRENDRWLFTHMMASDEQPTIERLRNK